MRRRANEHRILQELGEQGFRHLRQAAQVLAIACSLDQRAGLQRSRDAAKSRHISGLVEQVLTFPSKMHLAIGTVFLIGMDRLYHKLNAPMYP